MNEPLTPTADRDREGLAARLVKVAIPSVRNATWLCVIALAVLSLLPNSDMPRTGLPDLANHFIAYAGTAAIAAAGCGTDRRRPWLLAALCVYAAILEWLQRFSPGRDPSVADFLASAIGTLCGGTVGAIVWFRFLRVLYRGEESP